MGEETQTRAVCAECGEVCPAVETKLGWLIEEHGCIPQEPCAGCGVRGCSARALHEDVANARRGRSQVERLEVLRRNGIEPPNGHIDSGFMEAIVAALLRLEAQVDGLPAPTVINVAPRVDAEVERVRQEFQRRHASPHPAEPFPIAGAATEIDRRVGAMPPRKLKPGAPNAYRLCGRESPTPGYRPCTRQRWHDGPCAHPIVHAPSALERVRDFLIGGGSKK